MLSQFFQSYAESYKPYKGGAWCYEDGCIYRGLKLLHKATGDDLWLDHIKRLIEPQILSPSGLLGYEVSQYNIDNVMPGRTLLYLYKETKEPRFLECADLLASQLSTQPRTQTGVYWHKLRYPWQVWLDGLYMGLPFQIAYGHETNQPALIEDAIIQFENALKMTLNPNTGLYFHAVDEARKQPWANPTSGHSAAHWARALGWLAMAMVDVAALVPKSTFEPLRKKTIDLLTRIYALRQNSGLWFQVIDRPDLDGNYQESSASAMFTYALTRAHSLGLINLDTVELFEELENRFIKPNTSGELEMIDICEVAGLGLFDTRYRDGSAEYYLTEKRVSNDAKGVGPMMMSYAAHLSASNDLKLAPSLLGS